MTFLNYVRCPECGRLSLDHVTGLCSFYCSICGESTTGNCADGHCDRDSCRFSVIESTKEERRHW